jgi:HSP20 family protein
MTAMTPTPSSPAASPANPGRERPASALLPPVDILEDAQGITLLADLPGVPRERLQLQVDGETLRIEAEMQLPVPAGMAAHHAEVRQAAFRRSFTLSKELDSQGVEAELVHGVLRVRIPKAAHAQPRRVEVQVA